MKFTTWGHDCVGYLGKFGYETIELRRERVKSDATIGRLSLLAEHKKAQLNFLSFAVGLCYPPVRQHVSVRRQVIGVQPRQF